MENYVDFSGQGFQDMDGDTGDRSNLPFAKQPSAPMNDSQSATYYNVNGQPPMVCDIKPRLTKSQHEMLESEYTKQNKPSTNVKKTFAEALGVSLDKVNNWFQNRRAKSKQDAKKAAGAYNLFHAQQQASQLNFSSDPEASPSYPTPDYFSMMQQCAPEDQLANVSALQESQHYAEHREYNGLQHYNATNVLAHNGHFTLPQHVQQDMFDSPQELNRRTLTQEQFDAFAQHAGSSMDMSGNGGFHSDFSGNHDVFAQVFPELQNGNFKEQHAYAYSNVVPPPISSHDSTLTSSVSDQSMSTFPSSSSIRDTGTMSSASSDWAGSRSSSVSDLYQEDPFMHSHQHPHATTSQWKPGQSVPVDVNALSEEFRQVAQARHSSPQQYHAHEQPLAWPADDAYERRPSRASSMLAQSMSNVGIDSPQTQHHAAFKSPAPPSNIAARRQRPRPAALGIASMRSQSYSGAQPGSPGPAPQHCLSPGQSQVRRIRSSNVLGGVAQGRIHKPMPGAPQRSPLAWSFSDAMNSPKGMRNMSGQAANMLAPPTPLSPNEFAQQEAVRPQPGWQSSGHVSRQPSISETDLEHALPYIPAVSAPPQSFSSPPHTPRYHQQGFVQRRIGNEVITENTPPQSAPPSQQSFPSNALALQYMQSNPQQPMAALHQMHPYTQIPQPRFMNVAVPEPQFQGPVMTVPMLQHQQQHNMVPVTAAPNGLPPQYAQGVPIVNAQGQLELIIPPQFMRQSEVRHNTPPAPPAHQMHTPPKSDQFESMVGMFSTAPPPPPMQVTAQIPKQPAQQSNELFVHEYSPPAEMKRAATPRKAVDTGPKNYSFANHGPKDFVNGKKSRAANAAAITASNSPASSS